MTAVTLAGISDYLGLSRRNVIRNTKLTIKAHRPHTIMKTLDSAPGSQRVRIPAKAATTGDIGHRNSGLCAPIHTAAADTKALATPWSPFGDVLQTGGNRCPLQANI